MENDSNYQIYAKELIKDVPYDNLNYLIKLFMDRASMNMGNEYNDKTLTGVMYIIKQYFSFIPVCYVASGFIRGSLGDYGTGRLVPKTVKAWLTETTNEYNLATAHQKQEENGAIPFQMYDLEKYPLGKAICKKIDWLTSGAITSNEWDKISLKQIAELIGAGSEPTLEHFGINIKSIS